MIVDFSNMSSEQTRRLNEIAEEIKGSYTSFVDKYSEKYGENIYFWATPFASRNTYCDETYLKICRILLAKELVDKGSVEQLVVTTRDEFKTLLPLVGDRIQISIKRGKSLKQRIQELKNMAGHFREYMARQISYIRYTRHTEYVYPDNLSVVIGPAISTDFKDYHFNDRYTTGINDYCDSLFFLPYYVNTREIPNQEFFDQVKNCYNYSFILDKDLLKFSDLYEIIRYWKYVNKVIRDRYYYNDIDVSELVRRSLRVGRLHYTSFDGLLMRKMIQRLGKKGVTPRTFIQWYEGRPFDVIVSTTIRNVFPDAGDIGYEGYPLIECSLGQYISEYQFESVHSPKKMAILSRLYETEAHQFCKDIDLLYVPSLRCEFISVTEQHEERRKKTILVLLSGIMEYAYDMLQTIDCCVKDFDDRYVILIKNHPTYRGYTLENYGISDACFVPEFVEGKIGDCLKKADIAITSVSTSGLEVAYAGVPLIVLYPKGKLGFTTLPHKYRTIMCHVAYGTEDVYEIIEEIEKGDVGKTDIAELEICMDRKSVLQMFES